MGGSGLILGPPSDERNRMKILIAVPTFENIYPDTFKAIWEIDKAGHEALFEFVRGYDCATARNKIVQRALDMNADYVLMVDNDVTVPKNILRIMLEDAKGVCLGYYAHRSTTNEYTGRVNVCKLRDENGKSYFNYPLESEYTPEELRKLLEQGQTKLQIHGGGMGCAFIKTSVFKEIGYPWYDWVNYADEHRGMLSEDLFFCEQCRNNGIPVFTDTRAACGHLFRYIQNV